MKDRDKAASIEEKWDTLKSALCETAEEVLGHEHKKQPDWFEKSEVILSLWMQKETGFICFVAMREAKDTWL